MTATTSPDVETVVGVQNPGSQINPVTSLRALVIFGTNFTGCSTAP
jgi:hypothetical protein